ncbi:ATP-grasp domain-containing protein [Streptomyces sp. NPDC090026]|uniref:ATP-grasp domain-containing protein n=1 Tax=Streptomyces sp. NPDC090026 TaxID=3365923 RepID=UPI0037FEC082
MSEHVLIVGTGRDFPARIRAIHPGARTTVFCRLDSVGRVRAPGENARVLGLRDDAPEQEWVDLAAAVHARDPFTRIGTFGERNQSHYASIAEALGLTAHSPNTVHLVHDKQAMRARLSEAGVDSTAGARAADLDALRAFVHRYGLPCVVKPVSNSGSAGITKVTSETELAGAFARANDSYEGLAHAGVLVEEFLDGPQFSVEAVSEAGEHQVVAITAKFSDPASFVELGHVTPARLTDEVRNEVHAHVGAVLDALGVEFGPTHSEICLTEKGPRLIETHVRMGGDEIPALVQDATGVDVDDCAARQTLGESILPGVRATLAEERPARCSAIWFAALEVTGRLDHVGRLDEARSLPGVTEVRLLAKQGAEVGGLNSSDSRVAFARALADTPEEAAHAARAAVEHLEFTLKVSTHRGQAI